MSGSLLFLLVATAFVLATAFVIRNRAAARSATAWIRRKLGDDVLLMSDCLLLSGRRGIRGVMGMTSDRIIWRAVRFSSALAGELELAEIGLVMWCDGVRGAHRSIKWRVPGKVLTMKSRSGDEWNFLLPDGQAGLWEKIVDVRLGERQNVDDGPISDDGPPSGL